MKIKLSDLISNMTKVTVASSKDDLVRVAFGQMKQQENKINLVSFMANNGTGLQVNATMAYAGEGHPSGVYVVKASVFNSILKAYEALGIEFVSLEGTEKQLWVKNDNGKQGLAKTDKVIGEVTLKDTQVNALYALEFNLKELVSGIKKVAYAIDPQVAYSNGIYFQAVEGGFTLQAVGRGYGAQANIKAKFTKDISKEAFSKDFFVLPSMVKALNVLKGDTVSGYVSDKYLVLKDGQGTLAIITLSGAAFPKQTMEGVFVSKDQPMSVPESFDFTIKKRTLEAASEIASCMSTNNSMLIKAIKMGDTVELLTGSESNPQTVAATGIEILQDNEGMVFSTNYLSAILQNILEESVTFRIGNGAYALVYGGDNTTPSAYLMGRKDSPSIKGETEETAKEDESEKETSKKASAKAETEQA